MKTLTSNKILEYISKNGQASGKELTDYLVNITGRGVRKQLKTLTDKKLLQKIGKPPKVYYTISTNKDINYTFPMSQNVIDVINDRYLYISPTGESKVGWDGFIAWCEKTKQDPVKTANEYISTIDKFDKFKKDGLVNGLPKMKKTFSHVYLDKLYYLDFYSIERFGKTKLGQMLLYAKQSQNTGLINQLINQIRPEIIKVVKENNIDGIVFIPPTVKREIQFMKELERKLNFEIETLSITKIKTEIIVPQKTLSKLEDRIENTKRTIIINEKKVYKNILLIDDAVGSGATLNETAKQIIDKNLVNGEIIGLAITGSFKGFDVISEV